MNGINRAILIGTLGKDPEIKSGRDGKLKISTLTIATGEKYKGENGLHKTSKGMREMNYRDTQQFERATMLQIPMHPLLVLCGVMGCRSLKYSSGRAL